MLDVPCIILRPCSSDWQACALKLAGLPVKTSRPAKFTPSVGPSGGDAEDEIKRQAEC